MTRVLIVEDSPTQAEQLSFILEEEGFEVTAAPDGEAALEKIATTSFDLVVSDIVMPGMTGYGLCEEIKKLPLGGDLPVVLLSSLADPMDIIRGLECGADNFITKPYEPGPLVDRLHAVLLNKRLRRRKQLAMGVDVVFLGKTFRITSEKEQILDLLISTFEDIVRTNRGLQESQVKLADMNRRLDDYNQELEARVKERTDALMEQQRLLHQAQKMEAVGHLTGGIAHDFNNLLTVVIGALDGMDGIEFDDPEIRISIDSALEASLKGAELTRQLLAFARHQPLKSEPIDLSKLIAGTVTLLRRTLGKGIDIRLDLPEDGWTAIADPVQVESALVNLSINARDAMSGSGRLTIATRNATLDEDYVADNPDAVAGEYACFSVTDNGSGMPPDVVARVFDPFFTTKAPGKGTGLGLSMVYGFAKQSGGHVKIYSEPGHGTTVSLYLPRADASDAVGLRREKDGEPLPVATEGETLMVVDDNDAVRRVVLRHLMGLGYTVLEAHEAGAALDRIRSLPRLDGIVTDLVMPGACSSADLAESARSQFPEIPIIYLSGFAEPSIREKIPQDAHTAFLQKPYKRAELARVVKNLLHGPC